MTQIRELPIGVQNFEELRTKDFLYIDKTDYIYQLANSGKVYFLSRPRRFGKSLLLSTMQAYFQGKKHLFEGLKIAELEKQKGKDAWLEYPVLRFDLNAQKYTSEQDAENIIAYQLAEYESQYKIQPKTDSLSLRFLDLIKTACEKTGRQVVVLVDEYDKPIISTLNNEKLNEDCRQTLKGFYSALKSSDAYLKFIFLTGVSQFSKLSIFSDLNHVSNLSLQNVTAEVCGITQEELEANFQPYLVAIAEEQNMEHAEVLQKLKSLYDGYKFTPKCKNLYNPFSLLSAMYFKDFSNYWYETGTPTFLIELIKKGGFDIRRLEYIDSVPESELKNFSIENLNPAGVLFQTGYLTIKAYDKDFRTYDLSFPNEEVKYAFLNNLMPAYIGEQSQSAFSVRNFVLDLRAARVTEFMQRLTAIIASLPYSTASKADIKFRERDYHTALYLTFALMGEFTQTEVHSLQGRADCIVETADAVYIFEIKILQAGTPAEAIAQIKEQGYAERYKASNKKINLIGVAFDDKTQNLGQWQLEQLA